jgi:hypothetical protein
MFTPVDDRHHSLTALMGDAFGIGASLGFELSEKPRARQSKRGTRLVAQVCRAPHHKDDPRK